MTLADRLRLWGSASITGRIVASKLPRERFLPTARLEELHKAIDKTPWLSPPTESDYLRTAEDYKLECYLHVRQGGAVPSLIPCYILGRAIEFGVYAQELAHIHPTFFTTRYDAEDFLIRLIMGDSMSPAEKLLWMSQLPKSAWATWSQSPPYSDPFDFCDITGDSIRACLGLDPRYRDKNGLLLLVYDRPTGTPLLRPTIADAGLFVFFEPPPPPEENHGWTRPWPPGFSPLPENRLTPRPEAVHVPIAFSEVKHVRLT
jgi:hypothetical protein